MTTPPEPSITADLEPCGHAEHPGKFINDWTDKERGAFLLGCKQESNQRLRARLALAAREAVELEEARAVWERWAKEMERRNIDLAERLALAERALEDRDQLKDAVIAAAWAWARSDSLGSSLAHANELCAALARLDATSPREIKS